MNRLMYFKRSWGGVDAMASYIQDRIVYPKEAIANKETARVFIEFVVDKSGSVKDVQLKRQGKKYFDDEAIRVVSEMPKWKAGLLNGKYVNTRLVLPIVLNYKSLPFPAFNKSIYIVFYEISNWTY